MYKKNKKMSGGYGTPIKKKGDPNKPKMSENEIRFRRKKAQGAGNAAERVSNLTQRKVEAEEMGKTKKASRVQKRIERTTKRGKKRSLAATAGRTAEELRSIGIQPSKELKFGGVSKPDKAGKKTLKKKGGVKSKKGMGG